MTAPPRRRWYQWFTQFSLRTLLLLVTLSAVGCWWFLQPETREEWLAARHLKLRRQVKLVAEDPSLAGQPVAGVESDVMKIVSAGRWRLLDKHGGPVAVGRCLNDQPHGKWKLYHPNGQLAAEGQMVQGHRDGLWRVWDAEGNQVSEVTYKAVLETTMVMKPVPDPYPYPWRGVVGMTHILAQFDGDIAGGSFTGGFCGTGPLSQALSHTDARSYPQPLGPHSIRHGPCRAWHPPTRSVSEGDSPTAVATPSLRFEGQYENDQRTGLWTYYDEQGHVIERGKFEHDRREGVWTTIDPATNEKSKTQYIAGRTRADHDRWMAEIDEDLASGGLRRQVAAIARLSEIGAPGQPRLVELLSNGDDQLKLLAMRTLVRQRHFPADALAAIELLVDHPDSRLALRAKSAIYLADPARRDKLLPGLVDLAQFDARQDLYRETVLAVYFADPDRRGLVVHQVVRSLARLGEPVLDDPFVAWQEYFLADLGPDIIPHLESVFPQASPDERLYIMAVLQEIISRDSQTVWSGDVGTVTYAIPSAAKPLIERAKADPDVRVRKWAELIGQPQGGMGSGMGTGGGFF